MAFDEDKTYEAILRLHDKVDEQAKDIRQVMLDQKDMNTIKSRLTKVERIVYGAVTVILLGFMATLNTTHDHKNNCDSIKTKQSIVKGVTK